MRLWWIWIVALYWYAAGVYLTADQPEWYVGAILGFAGALLVGHAQRSITQVPTE